MTLVVGGHHKTLRGTQTNRLRYATQSVSDPHGGVATALDLTIEQANPAAWHCASNAGVLRRDLGDAPCGGTFLAQPLDQSVQAAGERSCRFQGDNRTGILTPAPYRFATSRGPMRARGVRGILACADINCTRSWC
jgi:hypothetical protein